MDAFTGEIRAFAFGYAPLDWVYCMGQALTINQYPALYAVVGQKYGTPPNSQTFLLPDLRGLVPMCKGIYTGSGGAYQYLVGETSGTNSVALTYTSQIPPHNHDVMAYARPGNQYGALTDQPSGNFLTLAGSTGSSPQKNVIAYANAPNGTVQMNGMMIGPDNGQHSMPHENRMPYLVMNFCICTYGYFPVPAQ